MTMTEQSLSKEIVELENKIIDIEKFLKDHKIMLGFKKHDLKEIKANNNK